jgi:hypothetical protein
MEQGRVSLMSVRLPTPWPATKDWRSSRDGYDRKVAGETASTTTASSLATPDAPTRERGYKLGEFQDFSSATEHQEPDEHYSQPVAFRVGEISMWSLNETDDADRVTVLPPVPEIQQARESTQGEYLAEANIVLEPDLVFGEPLEEPQAYLSQRRRALLVFLLGICAIIGVGVGGGGGTTPAFIDPTPAPSTSASPTPAPSTSVARSNGYIVATSSQLVKGTLHSCCSYVKSHRESRVTRNLFLTRPVFFIL